MARRSPRPDPDQEALALWRGVVAMLGVSLPWWQGGTERMPGKASR